MRNQAHIACRHDWQPHWKLTCRVLSFVCTLVPIAGWGQTEQASPPRPKYTEEGVLALFKHEPTVQQVQQAAIRYYQVHPDRIWQLRRGAEWKGLVPTISGEFSTALTNTKRLMDDGLYVQALPFKEDERVSGDQLGFRIQASWILDRLVFNAEVLDVASLIGILDGVVREVTTVYYIRRRLQIDILLRPPKSLATRLSQKIRIEELTGLLDAMTGSFMSRELRNQERKRRRLLRRRRAAADAEILEASADM